MLPITCCNLNPKLRVVPYYLNINKFSKFSVGIRKRRLFSNKKQVSLYIKQQGLCNYCKLPITYETYSNEVFTNRLFDVTEESKPEINHIIPISKGVKLSRTEHKKLDSIANCELLHKECHNSITYNTHTGEPYAGRPARTVRSGRKSFKQEK